MLKKSSVLIVFAALTACGRGEQETPATPELTAEPAAATAPGPYAGATAFVGANLWDGTGSRTRNGVTMIVRDGRVAEIIEGPADGAESVDLGGAYVVPGFINAHAHVSGRWADDAVTDTADRVRGDLALYARYGVTTVLSLGGAPAEAFAVRDAQAGSGLDHARLRLAGPVVSDEDPAAARAAAMANVELGVDWFKLRIDDNLGTGRKMPWDAAQAVFDVARQAGVPVATHIFYMQDAAEVLERGSGLIAHSVRDQRVTDDFVAKLLAAGVCYVPTLTREVSTFAYAERPDFFDDPFFTEAAKQSEVERVSQPEFMASVAASPSAAAYRKALVQAQENLRILLGSGVPIAFGTDSGPAGRFPGYFEHVEFFLMVEAGVTPREALLSATSVAAGCLGLDELGTLEPGKWADFVVLADDPLEDIRATRSVRNVYIAGNEVKR